MAGRSLGGGPPARSALTPATAEQFRVVLFLSRAKRLASSASISCVDSFRRTVDFACPPSCGDFDDAGVAGIYACPPSQLLLVTTALGCDAAPSRRELPNNR